MPKNKISEFDVNPDNNTDINSINIAEGCAPSGINNAIRQLMSDLKEFQTGAGGDSFNGAVGASTPSTGAFTTLTSNSTSTLNGTTIPASKTLVDTDSSQTISNKTLTMPVINGTIVEDVFTITDGAGFVIDPTNGSIQVVTLGASRTPTVANFDAGEAITLLINDGSAFTITWTTIGVVFVGGTAPTLATTGFTVIELWKVGSTIYGALVGSVA